MRDIYFGMRWVEKELRWEIHNLIHNKQGCDVREVWAWIGNEQRKSRTEPMKSIDCRKAKKQSCMGKWRFDISGWDADICFNIAKQWIISVKKWIPKKGWRYQVSKMKDVRQWSNRYYGGHFQIVNITLGKEYVETGRFIFDFLCETDCLFYHRAGKKRGQMVGKIWDIMEDDYFIINVVGWNKFEVPLTIDPSRKSSVMAVFPIWKATLEKSLEKAEYSNVDLDMRSLSGKLFIEWEVK